MNDIRTLFAGAFARVRRVTNERQCIIHIGTHKTGTSALQAFLLQNRQLLRRRGILVPHAGMSKRSGAHHNLVRKIAGFPVLSKYEDCLAQLHQQVTRSKCHTIIISSELMETLLLANREFSRVFDVFSELGCRVRVLFYVRNAPQRFNSQYAQVVKAFRTNVPFVVYVRNALKRRSASSLPLLEALDAQKIEWIARPYTSRTRHIGIVRDFFDALELDVLDQTQEVARTNESIGPVAIHAARTLMDDIPGGVAKLEHGRASRCGAALRRTILAMGLAEPSYTGVSAQLATRITRASQADCDEFSRRAWGRLWNEVFAEDADHIYEANDLACVEPTIEQQEALRELLDRLRPSIAQIINRSVVKELAEPRRAHIVNFAARGTDIGIQGDR